MPWRWIAWHEEPADPDLMLHSIRMTLRGDEHQADQDGASKAEISPPADHIRMVIPATGPTLHRTDPASRVLVHPELGL